MKTRKEYMDRKVSHRDYYAQFVTDRIKSNVKREFMRLLRLSEDPHYNDIPLHRWDNLGRVLFGSFANSYHELRREVGEVDSPAVRVCVMKEAARQLLEEDNQKPERN